MTKNKTKKKSSSNKKKIQTEVKYCIEIPHSPFTIEVKKDGYHSFVSLTNNAQNGALFMIMGFILDVPDSDISDALSRNCTKDEAARAVKWVYKYYASNPNYAVRAAS